MNASLAPLLLWKTTNQEKCAPRLACIQLGCTGWACCRRNKINTPNTCQTHANVFASSIRIALHGRTHGECGSYIHRLCHCCSAAFPRCKLSSSIKSQCSCNCEWSVHSTPPLFCRPSIVKVLLKTGYHAHPLLQRVAETRMCNFSYRSLVVRTRQPQSHCKKTSQPDCHGNSARPRTGKQENKSCKCGCVNVHM